MVYLISTLAINYYKKFTLLAIVLDYEVTIIGMYAISGQF